MSENGHNNGTRTFSDEFLRAQFQPGVSGNASGRPKSRFISQATRRGIEELDPETGRQRAEEVFLAMYKEAKGGNVQAALWLRETCEGKLTETFLGIVDSPGVNGPGNVHDILMAKLFGPLPEPASVPPIPIRSVTSENGSVAARLRQEMKLLQEDSQNGT
jgi:hypothetical protein